MKGFYISVKNDLLEPKHIQNMSDSVWLYMWLLDKITSITEAGVGKVSGGQPVTTEDIQVELGLPIRTYRRYVARLKKHGYIDTKRSPHGLIFSVNKATKPFKRSAKSGTSLVPKVAHDNTNSDVPQSVQRSAKLAHVYIDNTTNVVLQDNTSITNVIQPSANKSNEIINNLFLYWKAQTGIAIQSQVRANRYACNNLLKRYTEPQMQQLIQGVVLAQGDRYAPRIADFRDLQGKLNQLLTWGKGQSKKGTIKI